MLRCAAHARLVLAAAAVVCAVAAVTPRAEPQRQPGRRRVSIGGRQAIAGEVLVRFAAASRADDRAIVEQQVDAESSETIAHDVRRVRSRSLDAMTLLRFLHAHPAIAYAEPNYVVHALTTPNDPRFPTLWGLLNSGQTIYGSAGVTGADIHAPSAWNVTVGSRRNVVAVIDSGMDYTHHDLANNVWSAPTPFTVTIGGVTIRCNAGTHGFNAINRSCDPQDDMNHGTHVAGTIGATGNNSSGVTGVNWKASIMAAKFLDENGDGTVADAINAIEFTIQAKNAFAATAAANVRVLSNSWAGGGFSQTLLDEIKKANDNGMLFVAAAGNDSANIDAVPSYPAAYDAPNLIAVAATTNQDRLADFSNYGSSVALGAPGVDIMSTTIGGNYDLLSGTSMATPHVAGAAALVLAKCPLDTARLKAAILGNVDRVGALTGWVGTGGRLNVDKAVRSCVTAAEPPVTEAPTAPTGLRAASQPGPGQVTLSWNPASSAQSYNIKRSWTSGGPYTTVASNVTGTTFVYSGTTGRQYYFAVSATTAAGESALSNEVAAIGK
jgi:subtilisin family serine protease